MFPSHDQGGGGVCVPTMESHSSNLTGRSANTEWNTASVGGSMVGNNAVTAGSNSNSFLGTASASLSTTGAGAPVFDGDYIGLGGNAESSTSGVSGARQGGDARGIFAGGGGSGGGGSSSGATAGNGGIGGGGGGCGGRYARQAGLGGNGALFWRKL